MTEKEGYQVIPDLEDQSDPMLQKRMNISKEIFNENIEEDSRPRNSHRHQKAATIETDIQEVVPQIKTKEQIERERKKKIMKMMMLNLKPLILFILMNPMKMKMNPLKKILLMMKLVDSGLMILGRKYIYHI